MADDRLIPSSVADDSARAYNEMAERLGSLDVTPVLVYLIDAVPAATLPVLAEQFRVTRFEWRLAQTESQQRTLIKTAIERRRYRGTPYAIERGLEVLGFGGTVSEWFEYGGEPYYFRVTVEAVAGRSVSFADTAELLAMIKEYKNVRSWLDAVMLRIVTPSEVRVVCGTATGVTVTVPPHP